MRETAKEKLLEMVIDFEQINLGRKKEIIWQE